jgi:drug/metabolite transporter (DMT)-like permease
VTVGLCLSWGFNNVAIKIAIHDIPPLIQSAARSAISALVVFAWTQVRGIPQLKRDGTLKAGIWAGILFTLEFVLIYRGLVWTTATRGVRCWRHPPRQPASVTLYRGYPAPAEPTGRVCRMI